MDNQNQADAGGQAEAQGQGLPQEPAAGLAALGAPVGAQLAALREKRGMSIEDVSARLKVSVQKLKRLEAGEWDALPGIPFIQGVVRSYARMLGGDPEPMIEPLRRYGRTPPIEIPQPQSGQPSIPKSPVRFRSPVAATQAKWPWALAALVVIAGAAWYFGNNHKAGRGATEPAELASAALAQGATDAAEPASQPVVADVNGTPPGADGATNAANSGSVDNAANSASASAAAAAGPGLIAAADPTHVVEGLASAATAVSAPASVPVAASAAVAGAPGNGRIALRLKADSWVEVRSKSGKVLFSQLMRAGAEQEITGDAPLKIVVGNVAGVESLEFNGQPVEIKSRNAGNVARLTLQ